MRRLVFAALAAVLVLAACGDAEEAESAPTTTMHTDDDMADMSDSADMGDMGMNMGDATATRADEVSGADLSSADFTLLDTRPPAYDEVAGTAWLATHDAGTTVTLELTGLHAGVTYIAHIHEGVCADGGGDHFMFDPDGSEMPPNEIHLMFIAGEAGSGFMTAENPGVVGEDARSLVVHPIDLLDNKLACAEF